MDDEYKNFIETVRTRSDIASIAAEYVPLKKSGGKLWGCCPFHQEKTASFSVSPDKGLFYCFGCQAGGDIFSFVQKIEDISFAEAASLLAGKCGVPLPDKHKSERARQWEEETRQIYEINALAASYFAACLYKTADGQAALSYLKHRGIGDDTIKRFSIGFAPAGGKALLRALGRRDITPALLAKARLAVRRSDDDYQDAFYARVMIPIKEQRGRVVGFGGRALADGVPKYINTAESKLFNKKGLLYGLDIALPAIKKTGRALIVEGYMDTIALHANGFNNAVASMGTSFSIEQARLLERCAQEAVFCYDSDRAGRQAAVRGISIFREAGGRARVKAVLPEGAKDPDEFILKNGAEKFSDLLLRARDGWQFQKEFYIAQTDFSTLAGKIEIVSKMLPIIAGLENDIFRQSAVAELSRDLTLDEAAIAGELRKYLGKNDKYNVALSFAAGRQTDGSILQKAERRLLLAAFYDPKVLERLSDAALTLNNRYAALQREFYGDGAVINDETAFSRETCEVFDLLRREKDCSRAQLMARLPEAARAMIAGLEMIDAQKESGEQVVEDCLKQVARAFWESKYNESRALAAQYESAKDERCMRELAKSRGIKNEIMALF